MACVSNGYQMQIVSLISLKSYNEWEINANMPPAPPGINWLHHTIEQTNFWITLVKFLFNGVIENKKY